jgi:hypothetical protein
VRAREDLDTITKLIDQRPDAAEKALSGLKERASKLRERLDEIERLFRVPPETRGYVYDDERAVNRIGIAQYYIGSSLDAPTPASAAYVQLAENALQLALKGLNGLLAGDLASYRADVAAAGIGLLSAADPLNRDD